MKWLSKWVYAWTRQITKTYWSDRTVRSAYTKNKWIDTEVNYHFVFNSPTRTIKPYPISTICIFLILIGLFVYVAGVWVWICSDWLYNDMTCATFSKSRCCPYICRKRKTSHSHWFLAKRISYELSASGTIRYIGKSQLRCMGIVEVYGATQRSDRIYSFSNLYAQAYWYLIIIRVTFFIIIIW